jgi:predicted DNA-binding transcriptional regulator AlpA
MSKLNKLHIRSKRYLRKTAVAERYSVDERTVDRMAKDGRIPAPKYLPGSRIPIWDEDGLDANDRRATVERTDVA